VAETTGGRGDGKGKTITRLQLEDGEKKTQRKRGTGKGTADRYPGGLVVFGGFGHGWGGKGKGKGRVEGRGGRGKDYWMGYGDIQISVKRFENLGEGGSRANCHSKRVRGPRGDVSWRKMGPLLAHCRDLKEGLGGGQGTEGSGSMGGFLADLQVKRPTRQGKRQGQKKN